MTAALKVRYQLDCPFCGGQFGLPDEADPAQAVVHSIPTCGTFDRLDAESFVATARQEIQRRANGESL